MSHLELPGSGLTSVTLRLAGGRWRLSVAMDTDADSDKACGHLPKPRAVFTHVKQRRVPVNALKTHVGLCACASQSRSGGLLEQRKCQHLLFVLQLR